MPLRPVHECECQDCRAEIAPIKSYHTQLNLLMSRLDEQQRRWLAAIEANRIGHGGTQTLHEITGLDINTIRRGRRELANDLAECPINRIRVAGGGRKRLEKKSQGLSRQ